jgi:hypothetical protein
VKGAVLIAVLALAAAAATAADAPEERAAAERERLQQRAAVEQKLKLADSMLNRSAGARRVAASGNQEALRLLAEARASFAGSRAALEAGNLETADQMAAESLRQLGLAVRLAPEGGSDAEQTRARYARQLGALQALQASLIQSAGREALAQPDLEPVREMVRLAQEQAEKGNYSDAVRAMDQAADLVLKAAPRLMGAGGGGAAASGAAALETAGARYQSHEDLVVLATLRANLAPERARELRNALERARALNIRAQDLALSQRRDEAMTAELDAIEVLQAALRAAGVISLK